MKYSEIKNKEVIDHQGSILGKVKDIEWDNKTKEIIQLEMGSGGIKEAFGMGESKIVPYDQVESIRDKVLLKKPSEIIEPKVQSETNNELDYLNL